MSWQNKIENIKFEITTGDGKTFTPLWRTSGKSKEFNVSIYDFIDVEGSLVDRKKPKSSKHTFTFFFQGENNIEDAAEFDVSASDPRAWTVTHPYYGRLNGQPLSINYNEDALNVTEVTVEFWESITSDFPTEEISVRDNVESKKISVLAASSIVYSTDVQPSTADITKIKDSNTLTAASVNPLLTDENNTIFSNALSKSLSSADTLLSDPLTAMQDAQSLLDLPSTFASPVLDKINAYVEAFNSLKLEILTVADKLFFEAQAAACISGICNASVNPSDDDYIVRTEIEEVVEILLGVYDEYLGLVDDNQVQIYNIDETYIPNIDTQSELYALVAFTTGNLFNFAFAAKQLRIVHAEKNTNVILMSHRYLGPSQDDSNLDTFIKINNIKLDELFVIKKGRELKYFI